MDIPIYIFSFVSMILSSIVSLIYAYIAYKKSKEPPKDEIWETATKILCCSDIRERSADEFALLYESLKLFKDNGCSKNGIPSPKLAIKEKEYSKVKVQ